MKAFTLSVYEKQSVDCTLILSQYFFFFSHCFYLYEFPLIGAFPFLLSL